MLANELGRRGIATILIDQKTTTAFSPQANATQARTMEHFRRLGFADEIRSMGLPDDYPTDIAYFTRYTKHELGRVSLPSAKEAQRLVKTTSGSWNAAELPHRVSQKFVEAILYRHAAELKSVSLRFSWRLDLFHEHGDGVEARIAHATTGEQRCIKADYLFAADGPRSLVRRQLEIPYGGDGGADRDFMGGQMLAIYMKTPAFYEVCLHPKAWMYCSFNAERRALFIAVDGKGEFVFHTQLRPDESAAALTDEMALRYFEQALGTSIPVEILSKDLWLAGRALVADAFQKGRIFLGGDAVHLFTPTGGMGYNTAIEDAVNIGWKLAAVLKKQAPKALLDSYQSERRPVALRNTGFARRFADLIGLYRPSPAIEADGPAGDASRRRAGEYLTDHAKSEFNIPGFTFGARYNDSPIVAHDFGTAASGRADCLCAHRKAGRKGAARLVGRWPVYLRCFWFRVDAPLPRREKSGNDSFLHRRGGDCRDRSQNCDLR